MGIKIPYDPGYPTKKKKKKKKGRKQLMRKKLEF
jgi:hypothetical protein